MDGARAGRIALFVVEQRAVVIPSVVRHWIDHERAILVAARAGSSRLGEVVWRPGRPWLVWRLLSGNNRELARGVGVYPSVEAARAASAAVVARAGDAVATFVFDRERAHGWCATIDGEPVLIAPAWHQSRRTNRLNLDKALVTLAGADLGGSIATLGGGGRSRMASRP